jgi:hypothetical protein
VLRKISALKARQNLGQVMNEVALRGDDYIIERAGRPLVGGFCPKPRNFSRPPLNPCYACLCEGKLISEFNSIVSISS